MNYSWFVEKVRTLSKEMGIKEAVDIAITEMPESFAIKRFLRKNKSEVELCVLQVLVNVMKSVSMTKVLKKALEGLF